jgi:hypothetical protein
MNIINFKTFEHIFNLVCIVEDKMIKAELKLIF